jgi:LacI family transcriptional regulator
MAMNKVDLKELAERLNLSVSTVSRALRDKYDISEKTKKRVLALAKELNYQPNPYASSLRQRKSRTIGVVIPEIDNNFFSLAINGIETVAQENNYHVLIYLTHENQQKEINILKHIQNGRVDGLLISLSSETDKIDHLKEIRKIELPLVFFDRVAEGMDVPLVTTDDYQSGFDATSHLIESGCRKIAYLSISKNLSIDNKRMKGYADALEKHKIAFDSKLVLQGTHDHEKNKKDIARLLKSKSRPDGIFSCVEKLAIETYEVCRTLGLRIPGDIKIVSFSNLAVSSLLNPSLTTITQPAFEIGKEAAKILFKLLEQLEKKRPFSLIENKVFNSSLIKRESTG